MKMSMKKGLCMAAISLTLTLPAAIVGVNAVNKNVEETRPQASIVLETAVLRQGAKGNEVKEVQRRLKLWGYYNGSVDGVFGAGTKAAVVAFQKKNGLTADGIVG